MRRIQLGTDTEGGANSAVMLAKLKGGTSETPDAAEVQAFCRRLKGHTFRTDADNMANPDRTPLPRGYRNVRIHDARDGICLGSIWWIGSADVPLQQGLGFRVVTERPDAQRIITILMCMVHEEVTEWRSTIVATSGEPGTLDLMVDIETRPRELLQVAGTPLPPHVIAFLAARAPTKAKRLSGRS